MKFFRFFFEKKFFVQNQKLFILDEKKIFPLGPDQNGPKLDDMALGDENRRFFEFSIFIIEIDF